MDTVTVPVGETFDVTPVTVSAKGPTTLPRFLQDDPARAAEVVFPVVVRKGVTKVTTVAKLPIVGGSIANIVVLEVVPRTVPT